MRRKTKDIEAIKKWVESRNGHPAVVLRDGEETELLRFDFGKPEENLKKISWEDLKRSSRKKIWYFYTRKI